MYMIIYIYNIYTYYRIFSAYIHALFANCMHIDNINCRYPIYDIIRDISLHSQLDIN